jgi:hypothetical protein
VNRRSRSSVVVAKVLAVEGDMLIFSSGYFPRVLAARWLGLERRVGKYFLLNTASLSRWDMNTTCHNP